MRKKLIKPTKKKRRYAPEYPARHYPTSYTMYNPNGSGDFWDWRGNASSIANAWRKYWIDIENSKKQQKKVHVKRLREAEITLDEIHAAQELMKEIKQ